VFDFSALAAWRGTIRQIRFYPSIVRTGSVDLDWLRFYAAAPVTSSRTADFPFTTEESWTNGASMTQSVSGGIDTLTTTGAEAYVLSSNRLATDADAYKYLKIRMKNNTASTTAKIAFRTAASNRIDEAKTITFPVRANDTEFHDYVVDMSRNALWASLVVQLRLHPAPATTGTIEVDSIRLSSYP